MKAAKKIQPCGDFVLVELEPQEKTTASGLVLPDTAEGKKTQFGTVLAVGPGKNTPKGTILMSVKVGDRVMFNRYAGTEVAIGDKIDHILLHEGEIYAVLT